MKRKSAPAVGTLVRIGKHNTFLGARCWRSYPIEWNTKSIWIHDTLGIVLEHKSDYVNVLMLGDDLCENWCDPIDLTYADGDRDDSTHLRQFGGREKVYSYTSRFVKRVNHLIDHLKKIATEEPIQRKKT